MVSSLSTYYFSSLIHSFLEQYKVLNRFFFCQRRFCVWTLVGVHPIWFSCFHGDFGALFTAFHKVKAKKFWNFVWGCSELWIKCYFLLPKPINALWFVFLLFLSREIFFSSSSPEYKRMSFSSYGPLRIVT